MFKREWRRQALILGLISFALASMVVGLGIASNSGGLGPDPVFGTANTVINLNGSNASFASDLSALRARFGTVEVVYHQAIPVPGSVSSIDLRSEDPHGSYTAPTLRLDSGSYPRGPDQVAVSSGVAEAFGLRLGSTWRAGGMSLRVVGTVENPLGAS